MLNKIQKIHLDQVPSKVCTTSADLNAELQKFQGKDICLFIGQSDDKSFLMYAEVYDGGTLGLNNAVAFAPPCPPYCGKGENPKALYVMV